MLLVNGLDGYLEINAGTNIDIYVYVYNILIIYTSKLKMLVNFILLQRLSVI